MQYKSHVYLSDGLIGNKLVNVAYVDLNGINQQIRSYFANLLWPCGGVHKCLTTRRNLLDDFPNLWFETHV
ncbi:hypothetical protein Hanom_Chr06g00559791 [Helianthus anomalus]